MLEQALTRIRSSQRQLARLALRGTGYKDDSLAVLPSWSLLIRCSMKNFAGSVC